MRQFLPASHQKSSAAQEQHSEATRGRQKSICVPTRRLVHHGKVESSQDDYSDAARRSHPLHVAAWPSFRPRLVAGRGVAAKSCSASRTCGIRRLHPARSANIGCVDMSAEGSNKTGKVSAGCLGIRVYLMKTTNFHRSLRGQGFAEGCRNGICRCTLSQGRSIVLCRRWPSRHYARID